jgi:hypothetical protein
MNYYTLKLYTPNQVVYVPSDSEFIGVVETGLLKDPDSYFKDQACPSILLRVEAISPADIELVPRLIVCAPLGDVYNRELSSSTGCVASDPPEQVFSDTNELTYIGKFTIKRGGINIQYIVSCESRPRALGIGIGLSSVATVMGDSSIGVIDGALPRALT